MWPSLTSEVEFIQGHPANVHGGLERNYHQRPVSTEERNDWSCIGFTAFHKTVRMSWSRRWSEFQCWIQTNRSGQAVSVTGDESVWHELHKHLSVRCRLNQSWSGYRCFFKEDFNLTYTFFSISQYDSSQVIIILVSLPLEVWTSNETWVILSQQNMLVILFKIIFNFNGNICGTLWRKHRAQCFHFDRFLLH